MCLALLCEMLRFMCEKHDINPKYCHIKEDETIKRSQGNVGVIEVLTLSVRSCLNLLWYSHYSLLLNTAKYCLADKRCDVVNVQNLVKSIIIDENVAFTSL